MRPIEEIEGMLFGLAKLPWLKRHDGFDTEEGRRMATRARALKREACGHRVGACVSESSIADPLVAT